MLPPCLLRASRSFRIFPICDSSKEGMCQTDQLRLKILPSRRWRPRWWRRRRRTWGTAQFVSKPSKSATRSFFLSSQVLQLSLLLADPVPWVPWFASPRLSPWLPSTMALEVPNGLFRFTMSASSSCYIFVFMCSFLLFSLARHSTCPVCRERLGNDGGGEQEQDGGEGYNGGDRDFLDMIW